MASLNTLRTKFGVVLSIVIAGALLAFILSLKTEMGFSGNDPKVGVIDGEKINYSEYYEQYEQVKAQEQRAEEYLCDDAEVVIVAYGASSRVARSAVNKAREKGEKVGLLRPITLWPFPADALRKAAGHAKAFLTVEMSMGQMVDDVKLAIDCKVPVHFFGRTGGIIPTPGEVLERVEKLL